MRRHLPMMRVACTIYRCYNMAYIYSLLNISVWRQMSQVFPIPFLLHSPQLSFTRVPSPFDTKLNGIYLHLIHIRIFNMVYYHCGRRCLSMFTTRIRPFYTNSIRPRAITDCVFYFTILMWPEDMYIHSTAGTPVSLAALKPSPVAHNTVMRQKLLI